MKAYSRHPKIQYWFWEKGILQNKKYLKDIDNIASNSNFDTLIITNRGAFDFWDLSYKPIFKEVVEYAHSKNIKVVLQLWEKGFMVHSDVEVDNAVSIVTEYEGVIKGGSITIRATGKGNRYPDFVPPIKSELLRVFAFKKYEDGYYDKETVRVITDESIVLHSAPDSLSFSYNLPELEGYTVYAMVSHYYRFPDLFSNSMVDYYKNFMDYYSDLPLDGIVVDEFKNIPIVPYWEDTVFRERIYGKHFDKYFKMETGHDLIDEMFKMRYCPIDEDNIRIKAINLYFKIFRESTSRVEKAIANYAKKVFGRDTFIGLHNTYHNTLQSDEIWATGCNWWEVPRKYAQTDEDITYPVRMGIGCQCEENLIYDMFYDARKERFFEKCIRDAKFGCRIHYHGINADEFGVDTGSKEFLSEITKYEEKIDLLNQFEPAMPKMELLVVFGFPALCNWYPDYDARNKMDINGKLNILQRVDELWKEGYFNALAPSDAIIDGRIVLNNGKFDYCGHIFDKLLFLYPQYSQKEVIDFIEQAISNDYSIKIVGNLNKDFNGDEYDNKFHSGIFIEENDNVADELNLKKNIIENGCLLEDGSVVISDYNSILNNEFCEYEFKVNDNLCIATFKGALALKITENGEIEKLVAGNLKSLTINDEKILSFTGTEDYIKK